MDPTRNDIPFDQYARYRDLQLLVELSSDQFKGTLKDCTILDVGGFFQPINGAPYLPIQFFFPENTVLTLDRTLPGMNLTNYVVGDGLTLPFRDSSFDWVNASDTIEHIPLDKRPSFLQELLRCARHTVTLSAPVGTPAVELAEELVVAYIKRVLGLDHLALSEHRRYGLPDPAALVKLVRDCGPSLHCEIIPSGNLYRWLYLMISRHLYISLSPNEGLNPEIDRLYNTVLYASDHIEPTYRNIYFISRGKQARKIKDRFLGLFQTDLKQNNLAGTETMIMDIFSRIEDQERWAMIKKLQDRIEQLTSELASAHAAANYYQRELSALSEIPPVRIWRKLKGLTRPKS